MQIFPIPILLSLAIILIGSYYRVSLRYLVLFFIPWVSTGWFYLDVGTTMIKPSQLLFAVLLVIVFREGIVRKPVAESALIMLSPFIISLMYNYFFFIPIEVFEVQGDQRDVQGILRTSLTITNITRLIYLIFGLLLYLIFSSIHFEKAKIKTILDITTYFICFVSILQIVTWYLDIYYIYERPFYSISNRIGEQMANLPLTDFMLKRINATFAEPSFFGFYLSCTLLFYLTFFGGKVFFNSWPVRLLVVLGVFSTSTTFAWGFIGVALITYLFYTDRKYKVIFYFVCLIIAVMILREFTVEGFVVSKRASLPIRWYYGWVLPSQQIMESPYFGYGLGTSFTQFIYTLIPHSIGIVGTIIFFYGLFMVPTSRAKKLYLFGIFFLGIGNFYLASAEMWIYLGLLSNSRFNVQNECVSQHDGFILFQSRKDLRISKT